MCIISGNTVSSHVSVNTLYVLYYMLVLPARPVTMGACDIFSGPVHVHEIPAGRELKRGVLTTSGRWCFFQRCSWKGIHDLTQAFIIVVREIILCLNTFVMLESRKAIHGILKKKRIFTLKHFQLTGTSH